MKSFLLRLFWCMVLLMLVVGCCRKITSSASTEVRDSMAVREVVRVISIHIPSDTVTLEKLIECDSITNKPKPFIQKKKSKQASVMVKVDANGLLTSTSVCDSLQKKIEAMDREIFRLRKEKRIETVVVTEYKTRQIDIVCRWITGAVVLFVLGWAALTYIKKTIVP